MKEKNYFKKLFKIKEMKKGEKRDDLCPKCGRKFLLQSYVRKLVRSGEGDIKHDCDLTYTCPFCLIEQGIEGSEIKHKKISKKKFNKEYGNLFSQEMIRLMWKKNIKGRINLSKNK